MNDGIDMTVGENPRTVFSQRLIITGLSAVLLLLLGCLPPAPALADDRPLRIGFSRNVFFFKHQNVNDILAAVKVWARTIVKERGLLLDENVRIYRSWATISQALREKRVDAVTLPLTEFALLPADLVSGPYFRDQVQDDIQVEFLVLRRKADSDGRIESLRGLSLIVHDNEDPLLATAWLDAHLIDSGLGSSAEVFSRITRHTKLSTAVLGVFFGKYDACLVAREGFETLAALNPQVTVRLTVAASSPPLVPTLFCFRSDLPETDKQALFREVLRLHESVKGAQVLRVFRAERVAEVPAEDLERSLALLKQWQDNPSGRAGPEVEEP